jgi:predicted acyltransferase
MPIVAIPLFEESAVAATEPVVLAAGASSVPVTTPKRLLSLDAYRGFVMVLMATEGLGFQRLLKVKPWGSLQDVLHNSAGWSFWVWLPRAVTMFLADQLEHRVWAGCTLWDLIQPSFMFIVGTSMVFSFTRRSAQGQNWSEQYRSLSVRCLMLCLIGFLLDSYGQPAITIQFMRVLQQIALASVVAFLFVGKSPIVQIRWAMLILVLHTWLYIVYGLGDWAEIWQRVRSGEAAEIIRNPGEYFSHSLDDVWSWDSRESNAGRAIDQAIHAPFARWKYVNFWPVGRNPYAVINALSSTATLLFGMACGGLLLCGWTSRKKLLVLTLAGISGLLLGAALSPVICMVKHIWTASFALYAAGWTFLFMAGFYWLIDLRQWRRWCFPGVVVGLNSIAMYVMASPIVDVPVRNCLKPFLDVPLQDFPNLRPILETVLAVTVLWGFCYWLYRRKIFFKV